NYSLCDYPAPKGQAGPVFVPVGTFPGQRCFFGPGLCWLSVCCDQSVEQWLYSSDQDYQYRDISDQWLECELAIQRRRPHNQQLERRIQWHQSIFRVQSELERSHST